MSTLIIPISVINVKEIFMPEFKERDKSKKRTAILAGAKEVFIQMGYKDASMDLIAETAGISKKTVYNHFKSKETLFEVIVDTILEERQIIKTIKYNPNTPLESQLRVFAESEISLIDTPQKLELSRFLTLTFLNDLAFQRRIVSKYPPVVNDLIVWLQDAIKDNRIKTENIAMTAGIFYSLVIGAITWPVLFTDGLDKQAMRPLLDEIINLFLAKYEMI